MSIQRIKDLITTPAIQTGTVHRVARDSIQIATATGLQTHPAQPGLNEGDPVLIQNGRIVPQAYKAP